jgi:hypothetical protein
METKCLAFRETPEFILGRTGEKLVAEELKRLGWYVIPSYDYSGDDKDKAPRLQGLSNSFVIPDLDIAKDGIRRWVEVKTKTSATWTYMTQRYEHGIPKRHWDSYFSVQRESGCSVWLAIYETGPPRCSLRNIKSMDAGKAINYELPQIDLLRNGFDPRGGDVRIARIDSLLHKKRESLMKKNGRDEGAMIYFPVSGFQCLFNVNDLVGGAQ